MELRARTFSSPTGPPSGDRKLAKLGELGDLYQPSMIVMNETQLVGNAKVELDSYLTWARNRTEQGGGGIATAISQEFRDSTCGAGEG
jgi:hypothetical protein